MEEEFLESDVRILHVDITRDDIPDILDPLSDDRSIECISSNLWYRDDILDLEE
jgi:hypothetical protein